MTVNLTRIYTKLGDAGETHLGDMSRVSKLHPRVEAYGTVDELNSVLGVALLAPGLPEGIAQWLRRVQNDLLDLGADLSVPAGGDRERLRLTPAYTEWLEGACDEVNAQLEPLRSFVIPGRHACGGAPARVPHRVPSRRAAHAGGGGRQPGGRALPEPALGPAVHPRARGGRAGGGWGAAVGSRRPRGRSQSGPIAATASEAHSPASR